MSDAYKNITKISGIVDWPMADKSDELILKEVLYSKFWWKNKGKYVKQFEKEFATFQQCKGGVAVTNGTVALEIALKVLEISMGDEVIVPAFTFYSTISAILEVGATPVIVDVLPDSFCIDPLQIQKAVTSKTKAIIPVHMAGEICDMESICKIASKYNLYIIEDSSHASGSMKNGIKAGMYGDIATFSFQNAKLLTAGEGGMIISNDSEILEKVLLYTNCGRKETDTQYQHVQMATNARLSEFQGAILHNQFLKFDNLMKLREENYQYFSKKLLEIPGLKLQSVESDINSHYMIMFYYDEEYFNGMKRDEFVKLLQAVGIPANISYKAVYHLPVFNKLDSRKYRVMYSKDNACIHTENISANVVCLAHNILLCKKEVLDNILDFIKSKASLPISDSSVSVKG